jgi:acyl dehydratase
MMMLEGLHFEDFSPGRTYRTNKRTVTEADLVGFTTICGFFEPLFVDREYVETETDFDRRFAPGALTFCFAEGLTILSGLIHGTGIAFLGLEMELRKPVFIGDTISVEIEVTAKRETRKADRGIVTFLHRVLNQDKDLVMEYTVKRMIKSKVGGKTPRG